MPSYCAVADCRNSGRHKKSIPGLIHHAFPLKNHHRLKTWINFCKRKDAFNPKNATICSQHFVDSAYERDMQHELLGLPPRKKLKLDAVPTLFSSAAVATVESDRLKRIRKRENKRIVNSCLGSADSGTDVETVVQSPHNEVSFTSTLPPEPDSVVKQNDKLLVLEHTIEKLNQKMASKDRQIDRFKLQVAKLKAKNSQLRIKNCKCASSVPLTPQQQRMLTGTRVNWKTEDIVRALTVRSVGLKAYETARKYWKLPLPSVRTLQRWAANFSCEEGVLLDVLSVMKCEAQTMDHFKRICSISFDEMNINSDFVFDKSEDRIRSHSKAQVLMVRGLFNSWKQPLYYEFDSKMDKSTLFQVINSLEKNGFPVVSITSDLGPDNRSLWKTLGITEENTSFPNPFDQKRSVYVFADVPHMIKLVRNHLLDDGIVLKDGTVVNKATFQRIIDTDNAEIKLCPKLHEGLVTVTGAERMRVRPAVQLLSNHTALLAQKVFPGNQAISKFIKQVNDAFDVLDSRVPVNQNNFLKSGYGMSIQEQTTALLNLIEAMSTSRFLLRGKMRKTLLPCQTGFIISMKSLMGLFESLRKLYGATYILTSRLNQDALESLFSSIRAYGGPNQNPSPPEFKYRLRLILLGSNLRAPKGTNVEYEDNINVMSARLLQKNNLFGNVNKEEAVVTSKETKVVSLPDDDVWNDDALHYLAGYIAWKVKRLGKGTHGTPTAHRVNTTWIASVSRGGLLTPEAYFYDWIKFCNDTFSSLDGSGFTRDSTKRFIEKIICDNPSIPREVAKEFITLRMKIRTKFLNTHKVNPRSRINQKKAKQFVNSKKLT